MAKSKQTTPETTPATVEGFDIPTIAKSIGQNMVDLQVSTATTETLTKTLQETATNLRGKGVKLGKSIKTCTWRSIISQTIEEKCKDKVAQKTCMNYVTSFVKAVNEGTPFSLSDSKGNAKGKGKGKTNEVELSALIAKAFNHADFAETLKALETDYLTAYENDEKPKLSAYFADYLKAEGFEITE
jgi:hypothetical protein